jgi:4-hydroxythreonine-4-phosphate dehydrogenase
MPTTSQKPFVGFMLGDPAGIGMEIVLKILKRPRIHTLCRPILIGNFDLLSHTADRLVPDLFITKFPADDTIKRENLHCDGIPMFDVGGNPAEVVVGSVSAEAGKITYLSTVAGYRLLTLGLIDGMIMAPLNKEALAKSGCGFTSEYEILSSMSGNAEVQSVVKGGNSFRSSVIGHVPFREIIPLLTVDRIVHTCKGLKNVLDMFLDKEPRICVAALNPHCGEGGTLGTEEIEIIQPAIEILRSIGIDANGPYPSDTIFSRAQTSGFDGILHLYHDQGNIAMKASMFETTALIYTNLPHLVLSTGHGSALDIASLGIANPTNLSYVVETMAEILNRFGRRNA